MKNFHQVYYKTTVMYFQKKQPPFDDCKTLKILSLPLWIPMTNTEFHRHSNRKKQLYYLVLLILFENFAVQFYICLVLTSQNKTAVHQTLARQQI